MYIRLNISFVLGSARQGIGSIKFYRIKKWPIVVSQIRVHKSKQKPFVVCCQLLFEKEAGKPSPGVRTNKTIETFRTFL